MREKIQEICTLIPSFQREIDWNRGQTLEGKDYCRYVFKNGSVLDNVAASEKSRGKRRHGGALEECVGIDGDILNNVILPIMNVSRRCLDGTKHDEETLNKSQIYINFFGQSVIILEYGSLIYSKMTQDQKEELVSLLRN